MSFSQVELTPRDMRLIQTGASSVIFRKDETIIPEDSVNKNLYQIKEGAVRVQKVLDGQPKTLATMTAPQMFGTWINGCQTNLT